MDAAEHSEQDLHDRMMARKAKERAEKQLLEQRLLERTIERDYHMRVADALSARVRALEASMKCASDLLAERTQGSPARSAGHNARLELEAALACVVG